MYILSWACPSPGIEPRMPIVLGWSGGLQTSIVAHSSRERSSACAAPLRCSIRARPRPPRRPPAGTTASAGEQRQRPQMLRCRHGCDDSAGTCRGPPRLWYSVVRGNAPRRRGRAARARARVLDARARRPRADRRGGGAALVRAGPGGVPRGRRQRHLLRRPRGPRARDPHATATGARSRSPTFGPGDIFGELAMFEDERRSATVEAIEPTSVVGVLGRDMRRLMSEHPEIAMRLVVALGRRLREINERLSRQSFQTVQSRVAVVARRARASRRSPPGAPAGRARHRHPGRSRAAGGLLARVGEPLPGGARARRRDLPGPGPAGRPRPRGAGAVCLLSRPGPARRRAGRPARRRASSRPAAWSCAATRWS